MADKQPEKQAKWMGNIMDQFKTFMDIDIHKAQPKELQKLHAKKDQVDSFNQSVTRKSMIRYLTIIIDFSRASLKLDLRPNRAMVTKDLLNGFIQEFTDQNPLSKLSIIATMKEKALIISDFQESLSTVL